MFSTSCWTFFMTSISLLCIKYVLYVRGRRYKTKHENRKQTITFIHVQICFFLEELQQVFFCGTSYSIETLMRIPLKPRKKISSVWIFLKVEESSGLLGSLEIINIDGASPSSQPLWGQFMQKEGQYLNLGKVTIKPRGIFIQSCKGRNLSNLKKKTYFSLKRNNIILNLI